MKRDQQMTTGITVYKYLKRVNGKDGEKLLNMIAEDTIRRNGIKLRRKTFMLNIRKKYSLLRVLLRLLNHPQTEGMKASSVVTLTARLDRTLENAL